MDGKLPLKGRGQGHETILNLVGHKRISGTAKRRICQVTDLK